MCELKSGLIRFSSKTTSLSKFHEKIWNTDSDTEICLSMSVLRTQNACLDAIEGKSQNYFMHNSQSHHQDPLELIILSTYRVRWPMLTQ